MNPPALSSLNIRVLFSFLYTWGIRPKLQGPLSTHRVFKKFFLIFLVTTTNLFLKYLFIGCAESCVAMHRLSLVVASLCGQWA